jgi:HlyD family secretion protein
MDEVKIELMSSKMFRPGRLVPALLGVGALLALAFWLSLGPPVPVARTGRQTLTQRVVASGRVHVPVRSQLGTMIGGIVDRVMVEEGSRVRPGDLLVQLDDAEIRAEVEQAEARLRTLRELDRKTAGEDVRQAEVALAQAERQLGRLQSLYKEQGISQEDLDNARDARDLAQSRLESARNKAKSKASGGSEERLAQATLSAAQARLAQARVMARSEGVILNRLVQPGDVVQPGQILLVLAQQGDTYLSVLPEEKTLGLLRPGQEATAAADAYPEKVFAARISEIAPSVDPERGTVEVKLLVSNPPEFLRPDMTVSVDIEVARKENALILPAEAVRDPESSAPWVLVVQRGRTVRRGITLGIRGEGMLEALQGLRDGDLVVSPALSKFHAGQRVRPKTS